MAFRRSGSILRFYADGSHVDPEDPEFLKLFKKRRFKSIEDETVESESAGWVGPSDASGASWKLEDMVKGRYLFLKMRMDKKSIPAAWMKIKLAEAERAERAAGKRISRALRLELRDKIAPELLERTLPAVSIIDVVWSLDRGQVYLFAVSARAEECFAGLWARTLGGEPPRRVTPETLVNDSGLPGAALAAWEGLRPLELGVQ